MKQGVEKRGEVAAGEESVTLLTTGTHSGKKMYILLAREIPRQTKIFVYRLAKSLFS